jgi:AraC-like DNA-binding protein
MLTKDMLVRLCRARDRLGEISEDTPTIGAIAREASLSPLYFIRQFKAVFGESPHQYRIRARLERARQLLVLGELSVTEVCVEVGFSSLGSFSALFSRRCGESPTRYRSRLAPTVTVAGQLPGHLVPGCYSLLYRAWTEDSQFSRSAGAGDEPTITANESTE